MKRNKPIENEVFVCVDCETTGLDPKADRVIEIAAAKFTISDLSASMEHLIDPGCEIPAVSIAIHNITQEMVAGKPKASEVLKEYLSFIGSHTVVGHNINFDIEMIACEAERAGIPCALRANPQIDTLRMARLYGESPSNSLEQLRCHFNIEEEGAHRAMSDVLVNIDVFRYLAKSYGSTKEILKTLENPIDLKIIPLGKHKGRSIKEIPLDYLKWAANKDFDRDLLYTIRKELKRRKETNDFGKVTNPFQNL